MHLTLTYPVQSGGRFFTRGNVRGYCFGFNGQYKDDEVYGEGNAYSFEYRIHDARLGRFLSVDPLSASFPWNSNYAFAENRVIDGGDLEGREWELKIITANDSKLLLKAIKSKDVENVIKTLDEISKHPVYDMGLGNSRELTPIAVHLNTNNDNFITLYDNDDNVIFTIDRVENAKMIFDVEKNGSGWGLGGKNFYNKYNKGEMPEDNVAGRDFYTVIDLFKNIFGKKEGKPSEFDNQNSNPEFIKPKVEQKSKPDSVVIVNANSGKVAGKVKRDDYHGKKDTLKVSPNGGNKNIDN